MVVVGCCCCCSPDYDSELATASRCSAAGSTGWAPAERQIRGHVSEASEGLEKMRYKNRGGIKRKHYPYAHEAKANNSLQSSKQRHTIDLTIVTKVLGLLYLHGGLLLLMRWSTRNILRLQTPWYLLQLHQHSHHCYYLLPSRCRRWWCSLPG